jgi:hypothetical protein
MAERYAGASKASALHNQLVSEINDATDRIRLLQSQTDQLAARRPNASTPGASGRG